MTEFTCGLIIGKFYPFHLGHAALIERAAARCERVVVIAMAGQLESIPLADRLVWMRETVAPLANVTVLGILSDAPVDYSSEQAWLANVEAMRATLRAASLGDIDAVFGGEPYVEELARRLTATAVLDDCEREIVPMSGTMARNDLPGEWMMLPPATRRGMAARFVVIGAESTGTTTLTKALVEHYRARFPTIAPVPEYGREFTYELAARTGGGMDDLIWKTEYFEHIAARQNELENTAAEACPLVIADTDAFATTIWERRYVGADSHGAALAGGQLLPRHDLYLVTDYVDVPFEQDGWRDGEHLRADMTEWFIDGLTERGLPWVFMSGTPEQRLGYALDAIEPLLTARMSL